MRRVEVLMIEKFWRKYDRDFLTAVGNKGRIRRETEPSLYLVLAFKLVEGVHGFGCNTVLRPLANSLF
jgi:hypothetical protein